MAQRHRLSLAAGERCVHSVPLIWPSACSEEGNEGKPFSSAHLAPLDLGRRARSGPILEWSAVVLHEQSIELEVFAQLPISAPSSASTSGAKAELVRLERAAVGEQFVGTFTPSCDRRINPSLQPEAVLFCFSNASSWFSSKEVELITLQGWLPVQSSPPPSQLLAADATPDPKGCCDLLVDAMTPPPPSPETNIRRLPEEPGKLCAGQLPLSAAVSEQGTPVYGSYDTNSADEIWDDDQNYEEFQDDLRDDEVTQNLQEKSAAVIRSADDGDSPQDEESARKARALAVAQRYGCAV